MLSYYEWSLGKGANFTCQRAFKSGILGIMIAMIFEQKTAAKRIAARKEDGFEELY